jgi:hypothetical protein
MRASRKRGGGWFTSFTKTIKKYNPFRRYRELIEKEKRIEELENQTSKNIENVLNHYHKAQKNVKDCKEAKQALQLAKQAVEEQESGLKRLRKSRRELEEKIVAAKTAASAAASAAANRKQNKARHEGIAHVKRANAKHFATRNAVWGLVGRHTWNENARAAEQAAAAALAAAATAAATAQEKADELQELETQLNAIRQSEGLINHANEERAARNAERAARNAERAAANAAAAQRDAANAVNAARVAMNARVKNSNEGKAIVGFLKRSIREYMIPGIHDPEPNLVKAVLKQLPKTEDGLVGFVSNTILPLVNRIKDATTVIAKTQLIVGLMNDVTFLNKIISSVYFLDCLLVNSSGPGCPAGSALAGPILITAAPILKPIYEKVIESGNDSDINTIRHSEMDDLEKSRNILIKMIEILPDMISSVRGIDHAMVEQLQSEMDREKEYIIALIKEATSTLPPLPASPVGEESPRSSLTLTPSRRTRRNNRR